MYSNSINNHHKPSTDELNAQRTGNSVGQSPQNAEKKATVYDLKDAFSQQFSGKAAAKDAFHQLIRQTFTQIADPKTPGSTANYNYDKAEALRQQALEGDLSWLPEVEMLSNAEFSNTQLKEGASLSSGTPLGAFGDDTIFLNESVLSNPQLALRVYSEEAGHALDKVLNQDVDSAGDEGALFSKLLMNKSLSAQQIQALKAENDQGVLGNTDVEFFGGDFFSGVGDFFSDPGGSFEGVIDAITPDFISTPIDINIPDTNFGGGSAFGGPFDIPFEGIDIPSIDIPNIDLGGGLNFDNPQIDLIPGLNLGGGGDFNPLDITFDGIDIPNINLDSGLNFGNPQIDLIPGINLGGGGNFDPLDIIFDGIDIPNIDLGGGLNFDNPQIDLIPGINLGGGGDFDPLDITFDHGPNFDPNFTGNTNYFPNLPTYDLDPLLIGGVPSLYDVIVSLDALDAPDGDGRNLFNEANFHFRNGGGTNLHVDADKVDLSGITPSDFKGTDPFPDGSITKTFNLADFGNMGGTSQSLSDGLVYGNIELTLLPNSGGKVRITPDVYDFDVPNNEIFQGFTNKQTYRNLETVGANLLIGGGTPFITVFDGLGQLGQDKP